MNIGVIASSHHVPQILSNIHLEEHKVTCLEVRPYREEVSEDAVVKWVRKRKLHAVIFDDSALCSAGFSLQSLAFAYQVSPLAMVFFALLEKPDSKLSYSLWRYTWMPSQKLCLSGLCKIDEQGWGKDYDACTGKVYWCSGGDSGLEQRAMDVRGGTAVAERDWEKIIICITRQLP